MSETKHTPEPWRLAASHERSEFGCEPEIVGPAHVDVDECEFVAVVCEGLNATEANAHRIVACVNALAGVEEPEAELARLRRVEEAAKAAHKQLGHLLWLVEVEHKIDGQHITADAHKVVDALRLAVDETQAVDR